MIDAVTAGRLHGRVTTRTARNGRPFATCALLVPTGENGHLYVSVISFVPEVVHALAALGAGDAVALSGALSVDVYRPNDGGAPRPSVQLTAHAITSPVSAPPFAKRAARYGTKRSYRRSGVGFSMLFTTSTPIGRLMLIGANSADALEVTPGHRPCCVWCGAIAWNGVKAARAGSRSG
jgi:hypothetical protein